MSDGPHRSLPLRKAWKELAKRGDQGTYDTKQVAEAAAGALASDFKNEVKWSLVDVLKSIFTGRDNSLGLPEIALQELEEAKSLAAGSVFGTNAVAWSIELINEGRFGLDAQLYSAISNFPESRLGAMLVSPESARARRPKKQTHLDEGVPL
jgi:hypothetical protein